LAAAGVMSTAAAACLATTSTGATVLSIALAVSSCGVSIS
jgi:hypothetical protein